MHRRSNLQCGELFSDFSVNDFGSQPNCNPFKIPQNMRPYSNRMCNNYDYTKNGIRTMFVNPVQNCKNAFKPVLVVEKPVIIEARIDESNTDRNNNNNTAMTMNTSNTPLSTTTAVESFAPFQSDIYMIPTSIAPLTVATRMPTMIVPGAPYVAVPAIQAIPQPSSQYVYGGDYY